MIAGFVIFSWFCLAPASFLAVFLAFAIFLGTTGMFAVVVSGLLAVLAATFGAFFIWLLIRDYNRHD